MLKLPQWFTDLAMCFSLANLCYLRSWTALSQVHNPERDYLAHQQYSLEDAFLTVVNILLLTGILRLLLSVVRNSRSRLIRAVAGIFLGGAFLAAGPQLFVVLYMGHHELISSILAQLSPSILTVLIVPLVLTALLATGWCRAAVKFARALTMFMFPQALINVIQVGWWLFSAAPAYAFVDRPPMAHAPFHRLSQADRIVWIVFDEFDERLAFAERPAGLDLREFDQFRSQAVYATAAHSPAQSASESLPSLITGKTVQQTAVGGPSELMLRYRGESSYVPWSREQNIFRAAHQFGLRTALVGWYHPYCRVIGTDLDSCTWYSARELSPDLSWKVYTESLGLVGALVNQFSRFNERGNSVEEEALTIRKLRLSMLLDIRARVLSLATDPRYDLIFLHLPIPHPPAAYDRRTRAFTNEGGQNYLDNLQGANDLLRDVRSAMESSNLWDPATIIITSDYPLRHIAGRVDFVKEDFRLTEGVTHDKIPFLLKMPNQQSGVVFQPDFDTVHTGALLECMLRGEVKTPEQANTWMNAHSGR